MGGVPREPGLAEAPADPAPCRVGPARGIPVAVRLGPADGLWRQHPLDLHPGLGPEVHRLARVQVDEARVRPAARVPDPDRVGRRRPARPESAADRRRPARRRAGRSVHVGVAEARRRAVQRRVEQRGVAVEVEDGVAAGDVEGQGGVELDALVDEVGGDAGVGEQARGLDHEPLVLRVDGGDRVRVVEGVEEEGPAGVALDLVGLVAARGGRAQRIGDRVGAAVRAPRGGGGQGQQRQRRREEEEGSGGGGGGHRGREGDDYNGVNEGFCTIVNWVDAA